MPDGLAVVDGTTDEDGVSTGRSPQRELIEGKDLATSIEDTLLSRAGESERSDGELGEFEQSLVVSHCRDGDDDFALAAGAGLDLLGDAGEGDGGSVDFGEVETAEDDLVGSSCFMGLRIWARDRR